MTIQFRAASTLAYVTASARTITKPTGTVDGAYDDLLDSPSSSNFTAPNGTTYTVTPAQGNPPLEWEYTEARAGALWATTMRLREISS